MVSLTLFVTSHVREHALVLTCLGYADPQADQHWWIVYFAPSSGKHVSPILNKYFAIPPKDDGDSDSISIGKRRARLAAIGPTTAASLESELGLRIDVVAAKPTPEALAEGISSVDEKHDV